MKQTGAFIAGALFAAGAVSIAAPGDVHYELVTETKVPAAAIEAAQDFVAGRGLWDSGQARGIEAITIEAVIEPDGTVAGGVVRVVGTKVGSTDDVKSDAQGGAVNVRRVE